MLPRSFESPPRALATPIQLLVTTTQVYNFPPGPPFRAKITVQDGGNSGASSAANLGAGGNGGNASISWRTIDPSVPVTITIGAGGVGPTAGTSLPSNAGGASSFAPRGGTALSSANGDLLFAGGVSPNHTISAGLGGGDGGQSLMAPLSPFGLAGVSYGGGGGGGNTGAAGPNGAPGAILIEYLGPGV